MVRLVDNKQISTLHSKLVYARLPGITAFNAKNFIHSLFMSISIDFGAIRF